MDKTIFLVRVILKRVLAFTVARLIIGPRLEGFVSWVSSTNQGPNHSQAPAEVHAMNQKDVEASPSVMGASMLIYNNDAKMIVGFGSSHSYISPLHVCRLNVPYSIMPHAITVSTLVGDTLMTKRGYMS